MNKIWQGASGGLREGGEEEDTCHSREQIRLCEAVAPLPHEWENWKAEEEEEEPAEISTEDTGHAFWDACETLTPLLCECGLRQMLVPCYVLQTRLRLRLGAPHHTLVSPAIVGAPIRPPCNFSCQVFSCPCFCPFSLQHYMHASKTGDPDKKTKNNKTKKNHKKDAVCRWHTCKGCWAASLPKKGRRRRARLQSHMLP